MPSRTVTVAPAEAKASKKASKKKKKRTKGILAGPTDDVAGRKKKPK
jgi:hypothetical protein